MSPRSRGGGGPGKQETDVPLGMPVGDDDIDGGDDAMS